MLMLELDFDGREWILEFRGRRFSAPEISTLRERFRRWILENETPLEKVMVVYNGTFLPEWLNQFQVYKFQRIWYLKNKSKEEGSYGE